ncbi:MAG: hypothetical protein JWQ27_361 [Ferruginibacter sp.]|nr:hypothetical protein [Ferruginibacter sp.]
MIQTSITEITDWLKTHANRIVEYSLNPPASDSEMERLKNLTPHPLPQDYLAMYKTYNGMNDEENWGNFFYGMLFYPVEEVLSDHEFRVAQSKDVAMIPLKHADAGIDKSNFYNPDWIGLASDGARSSLRLDLSPTSEGDYGQVIFVDGDQQVALLIANSVTELLGNFSQDLKSGLYSLNEEALEDGQHFLEPAQSIDIGNWHHVEKWKKYL